MQKEIVLYILEKSEQNLKMHQHSNFKEVPCFFVQKNKAYG